MWALIKKYYSPIITESEFRLVQGKRLSNQEVKIKTIVLNASPRKNWNTAQLLKSAMEGAESTGAEVEYM